MNIKMTSLILMAALVAPGIGCWADDTNATGNNNDPITHPVNAYTNHEVKEDKKDMENNSMDAAKDKAAYEQAKTDYEKSLSVNGPDSSVTVAAKKDMIRLHKHMHKHNKKAMEAKNEMEKHQI